MAKDSVRYEDGTAILETETSILHSVDILRFGNTTAVHPDTMNASEREEIRRDLLPVARQVLRAASQVVHTD